jgi:uncharacterized protein YdaU (DUF1376 family)
MSKAPAMPMFWDAYLADTTHLTTEEHGAYLLLLAAMWRRNGSVPDDDKDNARILGLTPAKWRKVKARLVSTVSGFRVENGSITQEKLQKIWKNTQEKIDKNRANGMKGGRPVSSENKDLDKANGFVSVSPNKSIPEPEPEPEPDIRDTNVSLSARGSRYSDEFEHWWKMYPRKKNKGEAFKAFQKAKKIVGSDRLFSALSEQLPFLEREAQRDGGQYCPHPASWLNAGSYDDEPTQPQTNLMTQIANGEYDPWNSNASDNVLPLSQARLPRD